MANLQHVDSEKLSEGQQQCYAAALPEINSRLQKACDTEERPQGISIGCGFPREGEGVGCGQDFYHIRIPSHRRLSTGDLQALDGVETIDDMWDQDEQ